MQRVRRVVVICAAVALAWCGRAQAQVLNFVPEDALGVFEVKNLAQVSTKVAKFAKDWGIQEMQPEMADPLGMIQNKMKLKQGVNRNGDMAIAILSGGGHANGARAGGDDGAPEPQGEPGSGRRNARRNQAAGGGGDSNEPTVLVLIPTDNYKSFVTNFKNVKNLGGDVSQGSPQDSDETLYIANWGKYAAVVNKRQALAKKPTGLKLQGLAAKEAQAKDAIVYANLKALRPMMKQGLSQGQQWIDSMFEQQKGQQQNGAAPGAAFGPPAEMKPMFEQMLKGVQQFVNDADSAAFSINLSNTGIGTVALVDFAPGSELGNMVAKVQNSDKSLLAGLPQRAYFMYGGMKINAEFMQKMFSDFLEPMMKATNKNMGPKEQEAMKAMQDLYTKTDSMTFALAAPTGQFGQESMIQEIAILHGNAQAIHEDYKKTLPNMGNMMGAPQAKVQPKVDFKPNAKTISGVQMDSFKINFNFDQNDPMAAQQAQMMGMMFGPDGLGGEMGAVNDKTFLAVIGGSDKLAADAVASAKANQDALSTAAHIKAVSGELPKQRVAEFYLALDNIVRTGVNFAQQNGMGLNVKLPPNLPPIGVAVATEGPSAHIDSFIPAQLIQSLVAAGLQAQRQMNGPGAGQGGGGL